MNTDEPRNGRQRESWHFDKRVPIALIVALAIHAFAGIWYAAKFDSRLSSVEQFVAENRTTDRRLSVMESQLSTIARSVERVERILDRRGDAVVGP
jgi:hypothetical protein